jgi:hypothetical protein
VAALFFGQSVLKLRHSGARRRREPGISRFLVLRTIPE